MAAAAPTSAVKESWRDSVSSLRVQYQMDTVEVVRQGQQGWMVSPPGLPADTAAVRSAWELLATLRGSALPKSKAASLEAVGLDEIEARTVDLRFRSGRTVRLRIGRSAADPMTTYWQSGNSATVFRSSSQAWSISGDKERWIDKALLPPFEAAEIRSVRVAWKDVAGKTKRYEVRMEDGKAMLRAEGSPTIPTAKAGSVFFQARQFTIDALPLVDETAPVDSSPEVSVWVELTNGKTHAVKTSGVLGKHYYVRHPQYGTRVKVLRGRFDVFKREVEELAEMPAQGPEPTAGNVPVSDPNWRAPLVETCTAGAHEREGVEGSDHDHHDHDH